MMNQKFTKHIKDITGIVLFENVGVKDTDAVVLESWKDAGSYIEDLGWENMKNRYFNILGSQLSNSSEPAYVEILEHLHRAEHHLSEHVRTSLPSDSYSYFEPFRRSIVSDFKGILIEAVAREHTQCRFFTGSLLPIYRAGHVPCGWSGTPIVDGVQIMGQENGALPFGRFIIY